MRQDIHNKIIDYLIRYKPNRIGVFGSFARGEDKPASDIDILVDFSGKVTLFDLGGIKYDLSHLLKRPVDIVTERGLSSRLRESVYKDLQIIYRQ
jgi:predicted nucleotidyltransferase